MNEECSILYGGLHERRVIVVESGDWSEKEWDCIEKCISWDFLKEGLVLQGSSEDRYSMIWWWYKDSVASVRREERGLKKS